MADAHGSYPPDFWEDLLRLIDAELEEPHTLIIVGGAAIGLRYNRAHLTTDIDSVTSPRDRRLWAAIDRACRKMQEKAGLVEVPKVSSSGVFDPPEDWESRLRSLKRLKLTYLDVKLPERHDLAISKVSRGDTRDFEAIRGGSRFRASTARSALETAATTAEGSESCRPATGSGTKAW